MATENGASFLVEELLAAYFRARRTQAGEQEGAAACVRSDLVAKPHLLR